EVLHQRRLEVHKAWIIDRIHARDAVRVDLLSGGDVVRTGCWPLHDARVEVFTPLTWCACHRIAREHNARAIATARHVHTVYCGQADRWTAGAGGLWRPAQVGGHAGKLPAVQDRFGRSVIPEPACLRQVPEIVDDQVVPMVLVRWAVIPEANRLIGGHAVVVFIGYV